MRDFKKNLLITLALAVGLLGADALASNVQRYFRDVKLPTQVVMEHQKWATPLLASTNYIVTTNVGTTSNAAAAITTFAHQPDYPRNLTITPSASTAQVGACTITVTGTNIYGATITEDFSISSTQSSATTGNKAFATVTNIAMPAACETTPYQATWIVGIGAKLGVKHCTAQAGDLVFSVFGGAYESTRGTLGSDSSHVESNTFTCTGTMDGATQVDVYYVQNFGCGP